jgi:hypothetical protein
MDIATLQHKPLGGDIPGGELPVTIIALRTV